MNYVINNNDSLTRLRCDPSLKRSYRRIKIELDGDKKKLNLVERRINKTYFACGCTSGAISVYMVIILMTAYWLIFPSPAFLTWWTVLATIFLASILGKIIGIVVSRKQLRIALEELEFLMKTDTSHIHRNVINK